jgi:hypothetical protein
VNSRYQAFSNASVVFKYFNFGNEAVGSARGVRDDGYVAGVLLDINAHYEHRSIILSRSGDDGLLCTTLLLVVSALGFVSSEDTAGLADVVRSSLASWDGGGVGSSC